MIHLLDYSQILAKNPEIYINVGKPSKIRIFN